MFSTLLQTKLNIPVERAEWAMHERLLERLTLHDNHKLVLISAPAGYRRTTLTTSWRLTSAVGEVCWLSLDEDDSEPKQFFKYLAVTTHAFPNIGSSLYQLLQSQQSQSAKNLMTASINGLASVTTTFLLILDDYHIITSTEIDEAMSFLMDYIPPQMTLMLLSRRDPGFPIRRLRARNELINLRADDLLFTEEETSHFSQHTMGLSLTPATISVLENKTAGWVSGLQMAGVSFSILLCWSYAMVFSKLLLNWTELTPYADRAALCAQRKTLDKSLRLSAMYTTVASADSLRLAIFRPWAKARGGR